MVIEFEFESKKSVKTFYLRAEYKVAKAVHETRSDTDLMIVEGAE